MPITRAARLVRWFTSPFYGQESSYWRAVTVCFLAASTFWLLNALNKTYSTRITYPLSWRYDTTQYIPVQPLPTEVAVNVTGRGWKLLRKSLMLDVKPAEVRLSRLPTATRFVTGQSLRPALQVAMEGMQFNYILTDTLWVEFDRLITRRLPLALSPATDGTALPYAARFVPESVAFRGPARTVDRLVSPYPVHLPKAPAGSSDGAVIVPIGGPALVETNVQEIQVRLHPRALLTLFMQVVPERNNFPEDEQFQLFPPTVAVEVQCFPEDTAGLKAPELRVMLNYRKLSAPDSSLAPVLVQAPALARGVTIKTPAVRVSHVR